MNRRRFLSFAAATSFFACGQAGANKSFLNPQEAADFASKNSQGVIDLMESNLAEMPRNIQPSNFMGYKPVNLSKGRFVFKSTAATPNLESNVLTIADNEFAAIYNALILMRLPSSLQVSNSFQIVSSQYITNISTLNPAEAKALSPLQTEINRFKFEYGSQWPQNRYAAAHQFLAGLFRNVLYTPRKNSLNSFKTPAQLLLDGAGHCTDFALGRYLVGQSIGIDPRHMALVFFASSDKDNPQLGHVAFSFFDPSRKVWTLIDGNGRSHEEARQNLQGPVFVIDNTKVGMDMIARQQLQYTKLVPTYLVTRDGILPLDSVAGLDDQHNLVFKAPDKTDLPVAAVDGNNLCLVLLSGQELSCRQIPKGSVTLAGLPSTLAQAPR